MRSTLPILEEIEIPTPCAASWETMEGNNRARHCLACNETVHDLSAMTRADATEFLAAHGNSACIRFHRRDDGIVMTKDKPEHRVGKAKTLLRGLFLGLMSWLGFTMLLGCSQCYQGKPKMPEDLRRLEEQRRKAEDVKAREKLDLPKK